MKDELQRYHRQMLLPTIGTAGQECLSNARVLLIGCGALGTTIADQLVRAGVGHLRVVDRDVVELTNLQRQVLFDEADVRDGTPKAIAAANRLRAINSSVVIEPIIADVEQTNIERLALEAHRVDLILDGTDNAETRYLVNDVAVKHGIPWVYGGCVATEGRVMTVQPPESACLRCVFPEPPTAGETRTCDTAGVLGPAASIVASLQAAAAIKILTGNARAVEAELLTLDVWSNRWRSVPTIDAKSPECPTCGLHHFDFLNQTDGRPQSLCGRNTVQFRPRGIDLAALSSRLSGSGTLRQTEHLLRFQPATETAEITVFGDGRVLIHGTGDIARAKSLYSRYLGG